MKSPHIPQLNEETFGGLKRRARRHHRSLQKAWSVNVLLPDGRGFYPDFILGVDGRKTSDNALLIDTKFAIHQPDAADKIGALHGSYGNVLILFREISERWVRWLGIRTRKKSALATNSASPTREDIDTPCAGRHEIRISISPSEKRLPIIRKFQN